MASILDEIKAEVEAELSQQPQEEKPASVLEDVKQEVSAEPQQAPVEEPQGDFFESAERWLEPAPTQKSSGDIFLGLISNKRSNELDDEEKNLFNALSDDEQYKVAQARKDIPLDDAQSRRIFEVEKSKMPSVPTSWEDWYNLGGDAFDVVKNVAKLGVKVPLGAAEFGRDAIKASDMTVSDEEFYKNLKKAKSSFYSFMAPAFEIPESVAWATAKAQEGGFGWADAAGEKLGLVNPEDRFERWKGRRLVSQAQAEYFREHPTVYSRMLDNPLAKDALSYIAKSQMESPEELAVRDNISVEEAKVQQDAMAREQIDNLTSDMESELPEENARVRIAGEFLLPGELGMGTMGAVSAVAKAGTGIAKGLKYIGKSADEIAEINKAAQALRKSQFAEMLKKRTERAEAVAQGAGKIEKAIEGWKPAAEKVNKILGNITTPVLGGIAGYSVSDESPVTGILSGVIGGVAARGVLKGTKVGLEIPTFVRELAEARKVAPLGKTFETLGKSAEGSALKAKILSRGGKTIDNILSNSVEYAKTGIHGTTLALATGALESADPEEMKQMLADGLAITLGGRALQHIKGKMMGNDPIIEQRERISDDSRIHRRYQEADPETQANLDQISDFDNAISARETKLNESESDLANLMAAYKGSAEDAKKIKLAQSEVEKNKIALDHVKRANVQTRNEFGREFLKTYANLQDITNGVMKSGQNNVGFNVLSTDQIYQKLRNDPANSNVPDADLAQMASQAGFYSNPAQQGLAFDRRKPSIVINADSIRERIKLFGESPTEALVHETSHFMDVVPEFQEALAPVRSMLFQNEIRDAAGNIKATTSGIFSKAKLVELFNDGYLRHLDPQGREAFSKLNNLWDESRGQLDENKVANYMKSEVMADLLGEVSSRHLSNDLDSATLAMWDRARIKAKKNLLDRAIDRFYGLGGRGDIVTAANTRAEFPPEAMAAARDAMRQIVSLNGEISPPAQEADMPAISKAQMMKNSALIERFGKDSPLFKTEFKFKVFDKDGNQVGESMPVTTPNPREGTFQSTDVGMKKLSGYGDIPAEAQGLQVPEGGTLVVSRDLVMEPDGVTPVMYEPKDAKKIDADRKKLITEALDTDDYGTPNRFEPVEEGSETYRGTFTPLQIQAIKDMPESLVPRTLKEHMLKINDAIVRGDGTRFIVDYAAVMNDNGKYQAFSPKMYDLVPIGMHLSSKGNFLVTTISVGRIFDKMRLWNERMPGRLRFWDNNLERTFDDFVKYLKNWEAGKPGKTDLDADPKIAEAKSVIFNDLLNLYDKATEYTNLERTKIPRRKGDPRGKDPNRTIMSIRVDHIAELIPNENATKLPVNYGFAKINFMPERMEGEVTQKTKYPIEEKGKWYSNEDYAKRGGKIVKMSPDEFLSQVKPLEIDEASRDNIDDLKNMMQEGRKLDPLAIYQDGKEDGRHRAIAAKELGITEIPVIDFRQEKPADQERIVSATYTDPRTGEVREGVNHKVANPNAPDEQTDRESRYYGFKTDTGRVVDREEAYRIAEESGQLKEATSEEDRFNADRGVLHSNMVEMEPTISEKPQSSEMIGADTIKPADFQTSAKPEADAVIKPFSNALVSSAGLINFLPAYHGTPFEVDKFKLANIGTGEGAQAYGWGLYFAQARKVAQEYKEKLTDWNSPGVYEWKGMSLRSDDYKNPIRHAISLVYHQGINRAKQIGKTLQKDSEKGEPYTVEQGGLEYAKKFNDALNQIKSKKEITFEQGNLYKVDIDVKDEDLLDWDKPLSEQPESVRDSLIQLIKERTPKEIADAQLNKLKTKGGSLYALISDSFGESAQGTPEKRASEALLAAGIPGIRYLDGMSRTSASDINRRNELLKEVPQLRKTLENNPRDWEMRKQFEDWLTSSEQELAALERQIKSAETAPTHNYVVFDENIITILDKNDKPVAGELPTKQPLSGIQFMPERDEGKKPKTAKKELEREIEPDFTHSVDGKLPSETPERGYFKIATNPTEDGRVIEYELDPQTTVLPNVAGISSIGGEQVAMLEADRHNTRGSNMGGPLHPWLVSNQAVAKLPDGRGFKPVWANMTAAFVTRAKNVIKNTTSGMALIQLMKEKAHKSNRKFVQDVMSEVDSMSTSIPQERLDALHVILELGAKNPDKHLKRYKKAQKLLKDNEITQSEFNLIERFENENIEKYKPSSDFLSALGSMKSQATKGNIAAFDKAFDEHISKYKDQDWYKKIVNKYKNKTFAEEASKFTFNQRGSAMDRISGIPFIPSIAQRLLESMDFNKGKNLDIVAAVQLSKDMDAFAIYTGDDPKQEAKMSATERYLRDEFLKNPQFRIHPSYDWMMLGPEDANNFILETPADPVKLFPDYASSHPKKTVREGSKETIVGTMKKSKIPLILK
jgi:hypothetical protein